MSPRRPPKASPTFTLTEDIRSLLEERGAHGDRRHGPRGYTSQFWLTFTLARSALTRSDPRATRAWPEDLYDQVLEAIPSPTALGKFQIQHLGDCIGAEPDFLDLAERLHLEPEILVEKINDLSFAEKSHLVDAATARQAESRRVLLREQKPTARSASSAKPSPAPRRTVKR